MSRQKASQSSEWRQIMQVGKELAAQPSIEDQYRLIETTARQMLNCQAQLWIKPGLAANGFTSPAEPPNRLMQQAFETNGLVYEGFEPSITRHKRTPAKIYTNPQFDTDSKLDIATPSAAVAVPLVTWEKPYGVLQILRHDGRPFSYDELEILDGLATQSAIALQSSQQQELERWRIDQLSLVRQVSAQIASVLDVNELARRVTQLILDTFQYYYVAVFTLEPGSDLLCLRGSAGPQRFTGQKKIKPRRTKKDNQANITVTLGRGIIGTVAIKGEEILANNVQQEARFRSEESLPETQAEVALPLKIGNRILGVLDVQSDQENAFLETDLLVLHALADNISVAIEDARLYSDLRRRADHLSSVAEVSNAITSILNLDELLDTVIHLIQNRLGYPFVQIFTVHPGRKRIFYEAGNIPATLDIQKEGFGYDLDDSHGIIPWVARQGKTILANNVHQEPLYRPSENVFSLRTQSEITVPLVFGNQVLGILDIQSDQLNAFKEDDQFLLEALADNIAIAMRNASLYRSELWRRQVADSMREVAGLLSADVDLNRVLDSILAELERSLPCEVAAIWLLTDGGQNSTSSDAAQPYLAAVRCQNDKTCPDEVYKLNDSQETEPVDHNQWFIEALQASQPIIRKPNTRFDPLGTIMKYPGDYSSIAAPLRIGNRAVGVLTLVHHTSDRYGSEAQAMTAAFASYAAVAIENTRLYEASHEQAWVATVLLQVTEATQAITDVNELVATIAQITPMLVGVKSCAIWMWDAHTETYLPESAYGLDPDYQAIFGWMQINSNDLPAFEVVRQSKQPLAIRAEGDEKSETLLFGTRAPVLFPLVARGEVHGAMLVDFSPSTAEHDEEIPQEEKLSIIQGIAYQTALAVENIRLLKSQKEEAYVSVALLQVAQAIVSLNDLNDILQAIVRITPILVGVKRTAIFLWDSERQVFCLGQSYGIPNEIEEQFYESIYSINEFPLLDAAREQDKPIYIELLDSTISPLEWSKLSPQTLDHNPGAVADVDSPNNSREATTFPRQFLQSEHCLLMGLPLSVKGDILGVMIAEESEAGSGEAIQHVRERRHEIITGISQQAALAIQNDLLQREIVQRERLEREVQLAREIQKTFLPHQLPQIHGYDLDVRWRPARQVSGDFYDLFELKNGKFGLVIADVADKGMPAALFMTLIRTLIRAAVQVYDSPSQVLTRVNDLLIPDAQSGMFVTVVYAMLDPKTNQLVFANGGHNPPFLLHQDTRAIERLRRSGIALGIMENIQLADHIVQLQPGDMLVLYTDGITEAFSPDGTMFGEEHLRATIQLHGMNNAHDLLDAIDSAVEEFSQSNMPSDDITMIALKRELNVIRKTRPSRKTQRQSA